MIQQDAALVLSLYGQIKSLEEQIAKIAVNSQIAQVLTTIPGFGATTTAELAGELGTI